MHRNLQQINYYKSKEKHTKYYLGQNYARACNVCGNAKYQVHYGNFKKSFILGNPVPSAQPSQIIVSVLLNSKQYTISEAEKVNSFEHIIMMLIHLEWIDIQPYSTVIFYTYTVIQKQQSSFHNLQFFCEFLVKLCT